MWRLLSLTSVSSPPWCIWASGEMLLFKGRHILLFRRSLHNQLDIPKHAKITGPVGANI